MTVLLADRGELEEVDLRTALRVAESGEYALLVDDEVTPHLHGRIAKRMGKLAKKPAVVTSSLDDATRLCETRPAEIGLLDIQFGSNLDAGIRWLEARVADHVEPRRVLALSQYSDESEFTSRLGKLDCFSRMMSKSWPHGIISDDALEELGADGRTPVEVLVSGVHRDARWITVEVPLWQLGVHVRVDIQDGTRFRADASELVASISDGTLQTLVFSGRADIHAKKESRLRLRIDSFAGQLEWDTPLASPS